MNGRRPWARPLFVACLLLGLLLVLASLALANGYAISSESIGAGSTTGQGGDYTLSGSVGQYDAGSQGSGGDYTLTGGFWNSGTGGGPTVVTLARFVACAAGGSNGLVLLLVLGAASAVAGALVMGRRRD